MVQTRRLPDVQSPPNSTPETEDCLGVYAPFLMNGFGSLSEQSPRVPVTILRDSGDVLVVIVGAGIRKVASHVKSLSSSRDVTDPFLHFWPQQCQGKKLTK